MKHLVQMCRLHKRQLLGPAAEGRMGKSILEIAFSLFPLKMNKHLLSLGFIFFMLCIPINSEVFLNKWAVHVEGGAGAADQIAARHGFRSLGQVSALI